MLVRVPVIVSGWLVEPLPIAVTLMELSRLRVPRGTKSVTEKLSALLSSMSVTNSLLPLASERTTGTWSVTIGGGKKLMGGSLAGF